MAIENFRAPEQDVLFPPDIQYPVSLAIYHHRQGSDTPVSGDMKGLSGVDLQAYRELQREG